MTTKTDAGALVRRLEWLASDIVTQAELEKQLAAASKEGRQLRVKMGIDPTFTDVHVGHAVPLRFMRLFQDHGHLGVLIIGDATARLGDPTGRNDQRPPLTANEVEHNAATYLDQMSKVLDFSDGKLEVRRNSEWFGKMDFFDSLKLAARGTVARMLERDDFQKRIQEKRPIHLHETMYPLMQGWDSVMVKADVELGGNDQLFNLHMGRLLQEREGQRPQVCITAPLLLGTDGRKMSKTYGNHIALNADAKDVFGKVMSITDDAMELWYKLVTDIDQEEVSGVLAGHPREAKGRLAKAITSWLHNDAAANEAEAAFTSQFREKALPDDIPVVALEAGDHPLPGLLKAAGIAQSTSEARRLIQQGGVKIDGEVCKDPHAQVTVGSDETLLQAGKRRFAKVRSS